MVTVRTQIVTDMPQPSFDSYEHKSGLNGS
jgi:hypothetical protein